MPTELGRSFSLDWRGSPPHMLANDIPVWYRYLEKWGWSFINLYYDCFVGGDWYTKKQLSDPLLYMWRALNARRIDAIGETVDEVFIIEVADNPGLRSVGQMLVYKNLWLEDPKIDKPVVMLLVCSVVDPDLLSSAAAMNIRPYVMPA